MKAQLRSLCLLLLIVVCGILFPSFQQKTENLDWKNSVKYGWCVYTFGAKDTSNINAINRSKPSMIRWFVEWDRLDAKKNGNSLRTYHLNSFKPFFKSVADNNITLIVQMWVKERFWEGDGNGGVQWAKPNKTTNYPSDINASYGGFVRDLIAAMKVEGVLESNIIVEGWNEPDLLWGVPDSRANYQEPWKVFSGGKKGFSKWTGGSAEKWSALHKVLNTSNPNVRWSNGCVGIQERYSSWIKPCYNIPEVSVLDLHYYLWQAKSAKQYCDSIDVIIERWDKLLPSGKKPYPFFIGEVARLSSGTESECIISTEDAAMIREICGILQTKYKERFIGVTVHGPIRMWSSDAWYNESYSGVKP
jgi:hypothetical protein